MHIDFTQGIVKCQKELNGNISKFLQVNSNNSGFINLVVITDPTIVVFAHRNKNYLIEETQSIDEAWGPFPALGQTQYLYWDINFATGNLSRGYTLLNPVISTVAPNAPLSDQHWFDTTHRVMNVWNGNKWVEKIRVFAGTYDQSAVLASKLPGSQVGLDHLSIFAGGILLGSNGVPLRDVDGTFLTTETEMTASRTASTNVRFDAVLNYAQAIESIPKFYLVSIVNKKQVALASFLKTTQQVNGIVREHLYSGEVGQIVMSGPVKNDAWSWTQSDIGRPLFCGPSGQVTLTPPQTGVLQQIGTVTDTDEIMFWPMVPILLNGSLDDSHDNSSSDPISITDHGELDGLMDDDHPQYFNTARGDARYSQLSHTHAEATATTSGFLSSSDKVKLDSLSSGTSASLSTLTDVSLTTQYTGDVLSWNGSNWTNVSTDTFGFQPAGSYLTHNEIITLTGHVTGSGSTSITTTLESINADVGTFTYPTITVDQTGRITAISSNSIVIPDPELTYDSSTRTLSINSVSSVVLPLFTASVSGLVPMAGGDSSNFLRADGQWSKPSSRLFINEQSGNYQIQLSDADNTLIRMTSSVANTVTIPNDSTLNLPIGTSILISQSGIGQTSVTAESGVSIFSPDSLTISKRYGKIVIIKISENTWEIEGNLSN